MAKKFNPIDEILNKSIKELKANSKAVETALEKFLKEEGIDVSEKEFSEIKQLTDTMNELDSILLKVNTAPSVKKKVSKKRKATKRKKR